MCQTRMIFLGGNKTIYAGKFRRSPLLLLARRTPLLRKQPETRAEGQAGRLAGTERGADRGLWRHDSVTTAFWSARISVHIVAFARVWVKIPEARMFFFGSSHVTVVCLQSWLYDTVGCTSTSGVCGVVETLPLQPKKRSAHVNPTTRCTSSTTPLWALMLYSGRHQGSK